MDDLARRAAAFAALGEPARLRLVEDLLRSDRSPGELGERFGLPSNLLAHHLDVLEGVGLVERYVSSGDRRRRYVRLLTEALPTLGPGSWEPPEKVVFVCSHNSARSQLASALWRHEVGTQADSAGTHPAERIHPGAVKAGARAGLDLTGARPKGLDEVEMEGALVVTVCDQAHEELRPDPGWWHWSIPDPVPEGTSNSFDLALNRIRRRIGGLTTRGTE